MLFDSVIDKIDRTSLFSLLEKADADPHLFYRATVEEEDTLSHCSMDTLQNCYASKVSDLTPDAFVGTVINKSYIEGTGEKEVVFRKGVFAVSTIKDLFSDPYEVIYFTHKEVKWYGMEGGNRLKIIRGTPLPYRRYLEDNEHIIKPESIEYTFSYSDVLYGDILNYLDQTTEECDWYIDYFPSSYSRQRSIPRY